jgi:hypothetical protein
VSRVVIDVGKTKLTRCVHNRSGYGGLFDEGRRTDPYRWRQHQCRQIDLTMGHEFQDTRGRLAFRPASRLYQRRAQVAVSNGGCADHGRTKQDQIDTARLLSEDVGLIVEMVLHT